jgi:Holliday junction resolvase
MPKNKAKGSKIERELFDIFIKNNYRCVRVAGSGVMENADCDLLAGKAGNKKYAIEVKSSKKPVKYISKKQIDNFIVFCLIFDLTPVVALRFNREGWIFIYPKDLRDAGKNWAITLEEAKEKGKKFSQFFQED